MKQRILGLISMSTLAVVLVGCGTQSTDSGVEPSTVPHVGGTAVFALQPQTSPNWFFPLISDSADTNINIQTFSMLYKPLVNFNQQNQLDDAHALASSVTWNASGTVYTIRLNPKWHWSNGRPVTGQDVVFTWQIMKAASASNSSYAWAYAGQGSGGIPTDWKSVTAPNSHTVIVTLTVPRNPQWFIRNGLGQLIPVPASVWNKYPTNMTKEMAFINSVANSPLNAVYHVVDGPYELSSEQANNYWDFVPNPHYDGHKSYLKKIVFQYETSPTSEFVALKNGTVNVGYLGVSLLSARHQLTADTVTTPYLPGFNYLNLNMSSTAPDGIGLAFQQLPVRQALQMGVNQANIIRYIFHGYGVPDDTSLAPEPKTDFLNPALSKAPYPYNPAAGKTLLERDGWHEVKGVMTKGDLKLEFNLDFASGSHSGTDEVELLKSDWAKEGIIVNLVSQPFNTVVSDNQANAAHWAAGDWDQGNLGGWSYSLPYPSGGALFATNGGANTGGYSNAHMDALIQQSYLPGTTAQTLSRLYAYQTYIADQLPSAIFLPWIPLFNVHAKTIHGTVATYNPIEGLYAPNYWWIGS